MKRSFFLMGCLFSFLSAFTQANFVVVSGKIVDHETRKALVSVSVRVQDMNLATVSNGDGEFSLKVPADSTGLRILFSHVGYEPKELPLSSLNKERNIIRLRPDFIALNEFEIRTGDATEYMKEVFKKIPQNYSVQPNQMVGFYRESLKKNNRYLSVTEAVVDVYKAPYDKMGYDQAKIYKARQLTDSERIDTIFIKYRGGINTALELDLVKNYPDIFYEDFDLLYKFAFEGKMYSGGRAQYVISFIQRDDILSPLFKGRMYVDVETQAISKVEFNVYIESNPDMATSLFIRKKPAGMKIQVTEAAYIMQYVPVGEKWFMEYSMARLNFRCRWEKRLFSSVYSIQSEMAITDRAENGVVKFPVRDRLKPTDVITEKVSDFEDENFWEGYNIIEPEQDIENAVKKISKKLKCR